MEDKNVKEVVAALIHSGRKFLIVQRSENKPRAELWEFVGGEIEEGETPEDALTRQCMEELAVTVTVGDALSEVQYTYPDCTVHVTLYEAVIESGVVRLLEHRDMRWITLEESEGVRFCPADQAFIKWLQKIEDSQSE